MQDITTTVALAHLARLEISHTRAEQFSKQLDSVLGYVSQMKATSHSFAPQPLGMPLADDVQRREDDPLNVSRRALLAAVPASHNDLIKVRAVL